VWNLVSHIEGGTKLKVFENMVLRRIFGPERDEVTWKWRRLHNEELYDLYCAPNIFQIIKSRRMKWAGHVARTGDIAAYRILVEVSVRSGWEGNIKMDVQEVRWGNMAWIVAVQEMDRWRAVVIGVMNFRVL
jgi:hypothetical protein